jgi:hypothetical protein
MGAPAHTKTHHRRMSVPAGPTKKRVIWSGVAVGLVALVIAAVFVFIVIGVALSSIPPGCGPNSDSSCTNPDAHNVRLLIEVLLVFAAWSLATVGATSVVLQLGLGKSYMAPLKKSQKVRMALLLTLCLPVALFTSFFTFGLSFIAMGVGATFFVRTVVASNSDESARPLV